MDLEQMRAENRKWAMLERFRDHLAAREAAEWERVSAERAEQKAAARQRLERERARIAAEEEEWTAVLTGRAFSGEALAAHRRAVARWRAEAARWAAAAADDSGAHRHILLPTVAGRPPGTRG